MPAQVNVVETIADSLRSAISLGELKLGEEVKPAKLAAQFEVSRIPVREACKLLEGEGLLVTRSNHRTAVAPLTSGELCEIFELRFLLEDVLIRRAVINLDDAALERAGFIHRQLGRETKPSRQSALNREFHETLYAPAEAPLMLRLVNQLRVRVEALQHLHMALMEKTPEFQREHAAILKAASDRNTSKAATAVRQHLESAKQIAVAALKKHHSLTAGKGRR